VARSSASDRRHLRKLALEFALALFENLRSPKRVLRSLVIGVRGFALALGFFELPGDPIAQPRGFRPLLLEARRVSKKNFERTRALAQRRLHDVRVFARALEFLDPEGPA
jgi:hypothetical protein